jgi:hypothetical protein
MTRDEPDQSTTLDFKLRPNCLITRRPLVFITPPRSLFWYKNPWQHITHILYEHGYKVSVFQLPFQKISDQKKIFSRNKDQLQNSHVFLDTVTYQNLKAELSELTDSTLTVITDAEDLKLTTFQFNTCYKNKSLSYYVHQFWCKTLGLKTPPADQVFENCPEKIWHKFLDHCIHLAEIDLEKD